MKAVMITFDQAHYKDIVDILTHLNLRGFTSWKEVFGRGSVDGFPHYGTHAYPSKNNAILTIIDDSSVEPLFKRLAELNSDYENLGLRAFSWNIEGTV